jgi:hypothetical protein
MADDPVGDSVNDPKPDAIPDILDRIARLSDDDQDRLAVAFSYFLSSPAYEALRRGALTPKEKRLSRFIGAGLLLFLNRLDPEAPVAKALWTAFEALVRQAKGGRKTQYRDRDAEVERLFRSGKTDGEIRNIFRKDHPEWSVTERGKPLSVAAIRAIRRRRGVLRDRG